MKATLLSKSANTLSLPRGARDIALAIEKVAKEYGAAISFWAGGKHPFALLQRDGVERKLVFSGSPSDSRRAALNQATYTRRACRDAGWSPLTKTKPQETIMTSLASTGKGSMFDAQPGSSGPASPVRHIGNEAIAVEGIPIPHITELAKRMAGKKLKGPPEYQAFIKKRNEWADKVLRANPSNPRIWDDMVAALELGGYKTTVGTLQQAVRKVRLQSGKDTHEGEGATEKRRMVFPAPSVRSDPAALLNILRDPPRIPDVARKAYGSDAIKAGGIPYEYRVWANKVRYPWAWAAFEVGGTPEQVAEALRKAGHPINDGAAVQMDRRWRRERWEAAEAERQRIADEAAKAEAKRVREERKAQAVATKSATLEENERWNSVADEPRPAPRRVVFENADDVISMQGVINAVRAVVESEVQKAMGGLDIETLKRKAEKWDAYTQFKAMKAKMRALEEDDE